MSRQSINVRTVSSVKTNPVALPEGVRTAAPTRLPRRLPGGKPVEEEEYVWRVAGGDTNLGRVSPKLTNFAIFLAGPFSAVSNPILQVNMRFAAFFKRYKICTLLHRSKLIIITKNRSENSANIFW